MKLFRIHAYEVTPQRLSTFAIAPRGGAFSPDASFRKSLDRFLEKAKLDSQPTVDFRIDRPSPKGTQPRHDVREYVLDYSFAAPAKAKKAAIGLAGKLGGAMDERSPFTLLILSAYKDGNRRRLVIWAFPKDEPFHFSASRDRARIKILKDAFSRTSTFRKAALFEGTKGRTAFWSGRVIDKQAQHGFGTAADYWVTKFLECRFALSGTAGTRLLAKCLRETHDALGSQSGRDQISNAIVALHASRKRRWSLSGFASEYLDGDAKTEFLRRAPSESQGTTFDLDKSEFEKKVNFRVFRLEDNVIVSAPFGTVGKSVKVVGAQNRELKCEGTIVEEKVRAKHG